MTPLHECCIFHRSQINGVLTGLLFALKDHQWYFCSDGKSEQCFLGKLVAIIGQHVMMCYK